LTFAEKMVRKIKEALLASAGSDIVSYSVAGRSVSRQTRAEAEKQLAKWQAAVWQQKHPGQLGPAVEFRMKSAR
jgi:hypothetical protein